MKINFKKVEIRKELVYDKGIISFIVDEVGVIDNVIIDEDSNAFSKYDDQGERLLDQDKVDNCINIWKGCKVDLNINSGDYIKVMPQGYSDYEILHCVVDNIE